MRVRERSEKRGGGGGADCCEHMFVCVCRRRVVRPESVKTKKNTQTLSVFVLTRSHELVICAVTLASVEVSGCCFYESFTGSHSLFLCDWIHINIIRSCFHIVPLDIYICTYICAVMILLHVGKCFRNPARLWIDRPLFKLMLWKIHCAVDSESKTTPAPPPNMFYDI